MHLHTHLWLLAAARGLLPAAPQVAAVAGTQGSWALRDGHPGTLSTPEPLAPWTPGSLPAAALLTTAMQAGVC